MIPCLRKLFFFLLLAGSTVYPQTTIFVASSDAPDAVKALADFVCDGVDDHLEINLAIESLEGDLPGLVSLSAGHFYLGLHADSSSILLKSNCELAGSGDSTELHLNDHVFWKSYGEAQILSINSAQHVTIRDLLIDGNRAANDVGIGIEIAHADEVRVENVTVREMQHHAIGIYGSTNITVIGCRAYDCSGSHGIDVDRFGPIPSSNITIANNHVYNQGFNPCKIENAHDVFITQNIFEASDHGRENLIIDNNDADAIILENIFVKQNVLIRGFNLLVERTGYVLFEENEFVDSRVNLTHAGPVEFISNSFQLWNIGDFAVNTTSQFPVQDSVFFRQNNFEGNSICDYGLWLSGPQARYIVSENTFSGFRISAISLNSGTRSATVINNRITNRDFGTFFRGITSFGDSCRISENILDGVYDGVKLIGATYNIIDRNWIFRNPLGNGIIESSTSSKFNMISENHIADKDAQSSVISVGESSMSLNNYIQQERPQILAVDSILLDSVWHAEIAWNRSAYDGIVDSTVVTYRIHAFQDFSTSIVLDSIAANHLSTYSLVVPLVCYMDTSRNLIARYLVEAMAGAGLSYFSETLSMSCDQIVDRGGESPTIPGEITLWQNYPNPFNGFTVIDYAVPPQADSHPIELVIHDILGRKIRALVSGLAVSGLHSVRWDAKNDQGDPLASGIYFYRMQLGEFVDTKRLVLLR